MRPQAMLVLAACLVACRSKSPAEAEKTQDNSRVLATLDGVPVTEKDLDAVLAKHGQIPFVQARYSSPEKRKELLDNLIRFEVMALEAKKRGYDRDPEVMRVVKERMVREFTKQEIQNKIKPSHIPETEAAAYYREHPSEFVRPEEVRVSQLRVQDKAKAEEIHALAQALSARDDKGFSDLVAQYSEDMDSKGRGGDSLFFTRHSGRIPLAVEEAAFSLKKPGAIAGPVETPQGYVILRLTDRRPHGVRPFEECKAEIQARLAEKLRTEKYKALVEEAKRTIKVEIHEDALAALIAKHGSAADAGPQPQAKPLTPMHDSSIGSP